MEDLDELREAQAGGLSKAQKQNLVKYLDDKTLYSTDGWN